MSEKDIKNFNLKLDHAIPDELELIEFLKDKPVKFIFKEALHLYKRTYTAAFQEDRAESLAPAKKFFGMVETEKKEEKEEKPDTTAARKFFGK